MLCGAYVQNKIGKTPFDARDGWEIDGCCLGKSTNHRAGETLFLDIREGPPQDRPSQGNDERYTYYGYKFEAVCTGEKMVDSTSEFCSVVR